MPFPHPASDCTAGVGFEEAVRRPCSFPRNSGPGLFTVQSLEFFHVCREHDRRPRAAGGVAHNDTGIASALLNTAQQIGGALGLAVLSTISTSAADRKLPEAAGALYRGLAMKDFALVAKAGEAVTHGYTMAFAAAGGMFLAGLAVTVLAVNAAGQRHAEGAARVHIG